MTSSSVEHLGQGTFGMSDSGRVFAFVPHLMQSCVTKFPERLCTNCWGALQHLDSERLCTILLSADTSAGHPNPSHGKATFTAFETCHSHKRAPLPRLP